MHFRAQRKLQGEVSLSEAIETDKAGNALYLQDVVGADDTMQEDLEGREDQRLIRRLVGECLTPREADVIRRRYGLDGHPPQTQRQVAAAYGISRSYVSRIEKRALEKLETALREHCYPSTARTGAAAPILAVDSQSQPPALPGAKDSLWTHESA